MMIEKYIPGGEKNDAYRALWEMMRDYNPGKSYADMIRLRLSGSVESAMLYHADRCGMLFSRDGHCVGWSMDGIRQVYPLYEHSLVIEEHEIPTGAIQK